jgi:hypothetical protein
MVVLKGAFAMIDSKKFLLRNQDLFKPFKKNTCKIKNMWYVCNGALLQRIIKSIICVNQ